MPASASPRTTSATNTIPEPDVYQSDAIKMFVQRDGDPLEVTLDHIKDGRVLRALRFVSDEIDKCEQDDIDLLRFLGIFRELKESSYVHYAKIIVKMPRETLLRGIQAIDKDMMSALPDDTHTSKSTSRCKRSHAQSESTNTDRVVLPANKKAKLTPGKTSCGREYGCEKSPEDYVKDGDLFRHLKEEHDLEAYCGRGRGCEKSPQEYKKEGWLLRHFNQEHKDKTPSANNPGVCHEKSDKDDKEDKEHTDPAKLSNHGSTPSTMVSPPLDNRMFDSTPANPMHVTTPPPQMYSTITEQPQMIDSSAPAAFNTQASDYSAGLSPSRQTIAPLWDPSRFVPPEDSCRDGNPVVETNDLDYPNWDQLPVDYQDPTASADFDFIVSFNTTDFSMPNM